MTPDRTAEIIRRAQTDAILMLRHGQSVYCPYALVDEATAWRVAFDLAIAAEKVKQNE